MRQKTSKQRLEDALDLVVKESVEEVVRQALELIGRAPPGVPPVKWPEPPYETTPYRPYEGPTC